MGPDSACDQPANGPLGSSGKLAPMWEDGDICPEMPELAPNSARGGSYGITRRCRLLLAAGFSILTAWKRKDSFAEATGSKLLIPVSESHRACRAQCQWEGLSAEQTLYMPDLNHPILCFSRRNHQQRSCHPVG